MIEYRGAYEDVFATASVCSGVPKGCLVFRTPQPPTSLSGVFHWSPYGRVRILLKPAISKVMRAELDVECIEGDMSG